MRLAAFDLETTGVDVDTCEVVQAAAVFADVTEAGRVDFQSVEAHVATFYADNIPRAATEVHGISAEDVADSPRFERASLSLFNSLTGNGVVAVSFNGCGYDIPIVARFAHPHELRGEYKEMPTFAQYKIIERDMELHLRSRHIDVMRLWMRVRATKRVAPWEEDYPLALTSDMFAGSLIAAHGFYHGDGFGGAHDAGADCRATLAVLDAMLDAGDVPDIETAIKWSNQPLPGFVDFGGKFKWDGDQAVITIGKQAGTPVEHVDRGFLKWMLKPDKDFDEDTKAIVRLVLGGGYPERKYEDE